MRLSRCGKLSAFPLALLLFAVSSPLALGQEVLPAVDGTIRDGVGAPKDGAPDFVIDGSVVTALDVPLQAERGIIEFDLVGVSQPITEARIVLPVFSSLGPFPFTIDVFTYTGDGLLSLSDWYEGTHISTFTYSGEPTVEIDATDFIKRALADGNRFAGFNFRFAVPSSIALNGPYVAFRSREYPPASSLIIERNGPSVAIISPASGDRFAPGGNLTIVVEVDGRGLPINDVNGALNGEASFQLSFNAATGHYEAWIQLSTLGRNTLAVMADTDAGSTTRTVEFIVGDAPSIQILNPGDGSIHRLNDSINVEVQVDDGGIPVSYVTGVLNGGSGFPLAFNGSTLRYEATVKLTKLGTNTLFVTAASEGGLGTDSVSFDVQEGEKAVLSASPSVVQAGAPLSISWTARPERNDWVGLYRVGEHDESFVWWAYTGDTATGSLTIDAPSPPGQYEFRYFVQNAFQRVAVSNTVSTTIAAGYSLTAQPAIVPPSGSVRVIWTRPVGSSFPDRVGLYEVNASNQSPIGLQTIDGTRGEFSAAMPIAQGTYEFRILYQSTYTAVAKSQTVIVDNQAGSYNLSVTPTSIAIGGLVTVNWTATGGSSTLDWIGLYREGQADNHNYLWPYWFYTGGATSGSRSFMMPPTPGRYVFRYLINDGWTHKAESGVVIVN